MAGILNSLIDSAPQEESGPISAQEERNPLALSPEEASSVPPVKEIVSGQIPGVYVPVAQAKDDPLWNLLKLNFPALGKLGLSVYKSADSSKVALFNPASVPDIKSLDQQGQLDKTLSPLDQFSNEKIDLGALRSQGAPAAAPASGSTDLGVTPSAAPAPSMSAAAPAPAGAQNKLASSRLGALTLDQPTEGPKPGQGRIINGLLKRAV
jgi:hypothetical protein